MKAQKTYRRKELAATISLMLAAYGGAALAQDQETAAADDADEQEQQFQDEQRVMEAVLVTGIRRVIMTFAVGMVVMPRLSGVGWAVDFAAACATPRRLPKMQRPDTH